MSSHPSIINKLYYSVFFLEVCIEFGLSKIFKEAGMCGIGYTAEVLHLSPNASEKDVYDFFTHCGVLEHVEILRSGGHPCSAYVTFRDAYALETAVLLTGATIVDQCVAIIRHGQYEDDFDIWDRPQWKNDNGSGSMHADAFVSSPGEAVTLAQTVVKTMVVKGYVLSKDAYSKARAFDESYKVSAQAAAKIAELSKRIGLTDKVYAGMETVKSVDQQYHVSDATKYVGRTTSAAATAFVNSSYFAKGALLVSDVLTRAAKVAADLGSHGKKSEV